MFLLFGVVDDEVSPDEAVVIIWLLHHLDLPVVTAPPGSEAGEDAQNDMYYHSLIFCLSPDQVRWRALEPMPAIIG